MPFKARPLCLPNIETARDELLQAGASPACAADLVAGGHLVMKLSAVPSGAADLFLQLAGSHGIKVVAGQASSMFYGSREQFVCLANGVIGDGVWAAEGQRLMTTLARSAHPAREWRGKGCTIKLDRPRILGILNLTPDSFYDGGRFVDPIAAVVRAEEMVAEGVDVIDIGGESTRPGAPSVGSQEELDRVLPVIERLRSVLTVPISIDTNKSGVADAALRVGANYVNDISGLQFDADMASVVAAHQAGLVVMHTRGRPDRMQLDTSYDDLAGEVYGCLEAAVESAVETGIPRSAIAVDPGIGFGKSVDGNLELQRRLPELLGLGCPVLLGTSRKSFIGKILDSAGPDDRLAGTLATVAVGVLRGAMLHRVHDVAAAREAAMVAFALS